MGAGGVASGSTRRDGAIFTRIAAWGAGTGLGLWWSSADALAQGCSMCRTAVEGSDDPLARGLSLSTLFMLAMPFAAFTTVAGWLFIAHRRGTRGPEGAGGQEPGWGAPSGDPGAEGGGRPATEAPSGVDGDGRTRT